MRRVDAQFVLRPTGPAMRAKLRTVTASILALVHERSLPMNTYFLIDPEASNEVVFAAADLDTAMAIGGLQTAVDVFHHLESILFCPEVRKLAFHATIGAGLYVDITQLPMREALLHFAVQAARHLIRQAVGGTADEIDRLFTTLGQYVPMIAARREFGPLIESLTFTMEARG
jgi:hypothetical protein